MDRWLAAVCSAPDDDVPRDAMAAELERCGDPRGEFIRLQLEARRRRLRGENAGELERRYEQLERAAGTRWLDGVDRIAQRATLRRGFVERIVLDAATWIARGDELCNLAPIRDVVITEIGDRLDALLAAPRLEQIRRLTIAKDDRHRIGDAGAAAIAACRRLGNLRVLAVALQDIGDVGLDALCAASATTLRSLIEVDFTANRVESPAETYGTDWMTNGVVPESIALPPHGRELEQRYGSIRWLHPASLLGHGYVRDDEL